MTWALIFLSPFIAIAGLNLTAASHIFILDCTENSALEEQAIDRVSTKHKALIVFSHVAIVLQPQILNLFPL